MGERYSRKYHKLYGASAVIDGGTPKKPVEARFHAHLHEIPDRPYHHPYPKKWSTPVGRGERRVNHLNSER